MDKIHILFSTHQGVLYDEVIDHFVVKSKDGEFAVFPNHVAVITVVKDGAIKIVLGDSTYFVSVSNAIVEFHNNEARILAQEAHIGKDEKSAHDHLEEVRNDRINENRKLDADYTKNEKDIIDNLKKSKAGNL